MYNLARFVTITNKIKSVYYTVLGGNIISRQRQSYTYTVYFLWLCLAFGFGFGFAVITAQTTSCMKTRRVHALQSIPTNRPGLNLQSGKGPGQSVHYNLIKQLVVEPSQSLHASVYLHVFVVVECTHYTNRPGLDIVWQRPRAISSL